MTPEEKAKAYDEALERARQQRDDYQKELDKTDKNSQLADILRAGISAVEMVFPQITESESEDERIRKQCIELLREAYSTKYEAFECIAWLERQKECVADISIILLIKKEIERRIETWQKSREEALAMECNTLADDAAVRIEELYRLISFLGTIRCSTNERQKEQDPIKVEVYEVGKGTTICGQDYKCKKDYKVGNCQYIKDAIYHCGRDGYLTDQNGVSWSCTPEWFKEYIQSNTEWAEEEKTRFVSGQFLQCKLSFDEFKEDEHYWLEYVGDDMYVGRSDNILNQKFHITPRQLYTLFSQQLEEVQGPPQEEKQVSLNYEPPFNENPSDREIIDALIHSLKEQDGFLTAINCVSTKAILSWLEKHLNDNSLI